MTAQGRWRRAYEVCRPWIVRELRPYLSLAPGLVAYGILRIVFAHVVGNQGFVTPSGSPDKGLVVFALVMLVTRTAVLVIVPLIVTYRIVRRLFELGQDRRDRTRTDDAPAASPPAL